jgi:hypothetical protein
MKYSFTSLFKVVGVNVGVYECLTINEITDMAPLKFGFVSAFPLIYLDSVGAHSGLFFPRIKSMSTTIAFFLIKYLI